MSKFLQVKTLLKESAREWIKHNPLLVGAAISFYIILSLGPVLAVLIFILGEVFGRQAAQGQIVNEIQRLVGDKPAKIIETIISRASSSSYKTMAVISSIPLLFFGTTMVFFQVRNALNIIWEVKENNKGIRVKLKNYSFSFLMLLAVGFFFFLIVLKNPALVLIQNYLNSVISFPRTLFDLLNLIVTYALITLVFAAVYKILTNVILKTRAIWIGSLVTSFFFTVVQYLVGLNAQNSDVDSSLGAIGSFTILFLWIFYSSLVFLFGACFTKLYSEKTEQKININRYKMKKIIVLGCGMMGSAIAADLSSKYEVTAADIINTRLNILKEKFPVKTVQADLTREDIVAALVKEYDIAVCAVPGFMGFNTLKSIVAAGSNVVDISFFNEDPFLLNDLCIRNNVTAVTDCGVAPGLSNIILGHHNSIMSVSRFTCMVGGLPVKKYYPFQYKAPFSPVDVIEEYTRPARLVENGSVVIKPALSEPENIEAEGIGALIAFNTDGLRTLLKTMKIPFMAEKTLRYPKHYEYIKILNDIGFFGDEEVEVNGVKIKPVDFTSKLLLPLWLPEKDEKEFTYMRINISGEENKVNSGYTYTIYDEYDEKTKTSSMARTTGYTCTAAVNLLAENMYNIKGISPAEYLGADENCFNYILKHLQERKIKIIKIAGVI